MTDMCVRNVYLGLCYYRSTCEWSILYSHYNLIRWGCEIL